MSHQKKGQAVRRLGELENWRQRQPAILCVYSVQEQAIIRRRIQAQGSESESERVSEVCVRCGLFLDGSSGVEAMSDVEFGTWNFDGDCWSGVDGVGGAQRR